MAAQNQRIPVGLDKTADAFGWCLLTDNDVTNVTFVNEGESTVFVNATTSTTAPASADGIPYASQRGADNMALADVFPGVTTPARLWARCEGYATSIVFVSHSA